MARLEFRLRIRAGRWRWLVAAWFAVLLLITALVRAAASQPNIVGDEPALGAVMFGVVVLVVLALALLVAPALAAQSVNGDRERGTLATLQVTRLSAGEIAVGKLLASWGTALVFLARHAAAGAVVLRRGRAVRAAGWPASTWSPHCCSAWSARSRWRCRRCWPAAPRPACSRT